MCYKCNELEQKLKNAREMLGFFDCHECEVCGGYDVPEEMHKEQFIGWVCYKCFIEMKKDQNHYQETERWIQNNK